MFCQSSARIEGGWGFPTGETAHATTALSATSAVKSSSVWLRLGRAAISCSIPSFRCVVETLTCFRFFGQEILLFWTARGELSDVKIQIRESR